MPFEIELITQESHLQALEPEWEALTAADPQASLFSTFDWIYLTWKHLHGVRDRLLVLVVREAGRAVLIAPLCVRGERVYGIPLRVVRFIAEWEGDRPDILTTLSRTMAWGEIQCCLGQIYTAWDMIALAEQNAAGFERPPFTSDTACVTEVWPDATGLSVRLQETWDVYLAGRSSTRKTYERRLRKFEQAIGPMEVENFRSPAQLLAGLERFLAVEGMSWKAREGIGVSKGDRHRRYYQEMIGALATKDRVWIDCLTSRGVDVAAAITGRLGRKVYGLQTTYNTAFAQFSPGTLLHRAIIKSCFDAGFDEFDLLAMPGEQHHKSAWATHRHETMRVMIYKKKSRALPLLAGKDLKRKLKGLLPVSPPAAGEAA